jgi:hypothetical protein
MADQTQSARDSALGNNNPLRTHEIESFILCSISQMEVSTVIHDFLRKAGLAPAGIPGQSRISDDVSVQK